MEEKRCQHYCGVACIDGNCPIANIDEYAERGYDIIRDCNDCYFYEGCKDCCFEGMDVCPKYEQDKGGE